MKKIVLFGAGKVGKGAKLFLERGQGNCVFC